jgi:hypothetical protein
LNTLLTTRRVAAVAGVAAIVTFIAAGAIEGSQPKPTATATVITTFYTSHHSQVLIGDLLISASAILLIVWGAVIAAEMHARGQNAAAGALLATIAARGAVAVVASAFEIGLDQAAVRAPDPGFIHGYIGGLSFLILAAAAAAVALGAGGLFSVWYRWLTGLAAVLALIIGISVSSSGFLSPTGGADTTSALVIFVWVVVTSVLLWGAPRTAASAEPVATAPTQWAGSA